MIVSTRYSRIIALLLLISISSNISLLSVQAQTVDLQTKIDQRTLEIKNLEKEIAEFQKQINTLAGQASTLAATIKSLDLTQKKLAADIALTEKKITAKGLDIQSLSSQIQNKEETIVDDRRIITRSLVTIRELDNYSVPEMFLSAASLSDVWNSADQLSTVQSSLIAHIRQLEELKTDLESNKKATEKAQKELVLLNNQLKDQRKVVLTTSAEKNSLLKQTKQSEAQYQQILAQKKALKDAFEKEVLAYESQLRLAVDTSKIPTTGDKVLLWPVDNVFVTQYFGNTAFATANSQIYNGKGHTGIDLRASIGTPIKAALSGTVVGVGNTDVLASCLSYGKWIMVKHPNGLSTLYAHLSVHSVKQGDQVVTGQIIGYSGNTGYSTGPHLHFSVYATEGVQIKSFDTSRNCKGITIPLADFKAYLNPLSFL
jgi:murein DD-endopeptidase MepM/ murein hydrolase activator NlpD